MPPSPPKVGEVDGENNKGGCGGHIVLMQRKVGNLGNLGGTTGWIYRAVLSKSCRL